MPPTAGGPTIVPPPPKTPVGPYVTPAQSWPKAWGAKYPGFDPSVVGTKLDPRSRSARVYDWISGVDPRITPTGTAVRLGGLGGVATVGSLLAGLNFGYLPMARRGLKQTAEDIVNAPAVHKAIEDAKELMASGEASGQNLMGMASEMAQTGSSMAEAAHNVKRIHDLASHYMPAATYGSIAGAAVGGIPALVSALKDEDEAKKNWMARNPVASILLASTLGGLGGVGVKQVVSPYGEPAAKKPSAQLAKTAPKAVPKATPKVEAPKAGPKAPPTPAPKGK